MPDLLPSSLFLMLIIGKRVVKFRQELVGEQILQAGGQIRRKVQDLHHLFPALSAAGKAHRFLGEPQASGQEIQQLPVGRPFFRGRGHPHFEAVSMEPHHFGAGGPGHHGQAQDIALASRKIKRGHWKVVGAG